MSIEDLSGISMLDLFRVEVDTQTQVLTAGLLALERDSRAAGQLEVLMRAAHSLKGAARIVNLPAAVRVAHSLEDCFVSAQGGRITLQQRQVDLLLGGVDLLVKISQTPESDLIQWETNHQSEVSLFIAAVSEFVDGGVEKGEPLAESAVVDSVPVELEANESIRCDSTVIAVAKDAATPVGSTLLQGSSDRMLRVTAESLNRLLGLAGEALVESRWLNPYARSLLRLKRQQAQLLHQLEALRETLDQLHLDDAIRAKMHGAQTKAAECHRTLADRLTDIEAFDRRSTDLSHRLYGEALACRMRPFADGVLGFPRMVRDVALALGKRVNFEVCGNSTDVDRDMLERLESPLAHLLRNAVDHGIETPDERVQKGKLAEGQVRLEARHSAGMFQIVVTDDGRGIDPETLRREIVKKKLSLPETAAKLSEAELLEFLFLPGFTLKESVTEISGRGVGLDVVQNMVKQVRGSVRISSERGKGTRFQLLLPLTLSVVRTLLVEIGGEPYAFPLACIQRTLKLRRTQIEFLEGRQHFNCDGRQTGLIGVDQILGCKEVQMTGDELPVLVVGDRSSSYGLVVDRFLGERELVVQPLDARLGKIKDVSAGALMEDGAPVLIMDVEDLILSIGQLVSRAGLKTVAGAQLEAKGMKPKRVLIVDDSLTVRELERKLLAHRGYEVEVAVDGMEGWNAVRTGHFDLVISDVDMPRMNGFELVALMKKNANTKALPIMIVSYKDREEDRRRGLESGADYYLTKGSFHEDTLLNAVVDLIGESRE